MRDVTAILLIVEGCAKLCPLLREKLVLAAEVKILKLDLAVRSQKRNLVLVFDGSLILYFECCLTKKKINKMLSIKQGSENKAVTALLWPLSVLCRDS